MLLFSHAQKVKHQSSMLSGEDAALFMKHAGGWEMDKFGEESCCEVFYVSMHIAEIIRMNMG